MIGKLAGELSAELSGWNGVPKAQLPRSYLCARPIRFGGGPTQLAVRPAIFALDLCRGSDCRRWTNPHMRTHGHHSPDSQLLRETDPPLPRGRGDTPSRTRLGRNPAPQAGQAHRGAPGPAWAHTRRTPGLARHSRERLGSAALIRARRYEQPAKNLPIAGTLRRAGLKCLARRAEGPDAKDQSKPEHATPVR